MKKLTLLTCAVIASLVLSACGGATTPAPSASPTAESVPPTSVPPTSAPAPTDTTVPVVATLPPAPPPAGPLGLLRFADNAGHNDRVVAAFTNMPPLEAATTYEVWLVSDAQNLSVGRFTPDSAGVGSLSFDAPGGSNLLADYSSAQVTIEANPDNDPATPSKPILLGALPPSALAHVRHVLVSFPATPGQIGFGAGMRTELGKVDEYVAWQTGPGASDLAGIKRNAERIINVIEGPKGEHFGDSDKNGRVDNDGDGFGLLTGGDLAGYLLALEDHARLAAEAADSNLFIGLRAQETHVAIENTRKWVSDLRDIQLQILAAPDLTAANALVVNASALVRRTIDGVDTNADERIDPIPGEGGALSAYRQAQLMAAITLTPDGTLPPPPPTPAPLPAGTNIVHMDNFQFVTQTTLVQPGAVVSWINDDSRNVPHTVTSVAGAAVPFDSGDLATGAQFTFTFDQPGSYAYFCKIHGDFMSGTIVVLGAEPTP